MSGLRLRPFDVAAYLDTPETVRAYVEEMEAEVARLQHDIARHVEIASAEATRAEQLQAEVDQYRTALADPIAVHANMLRGSIAKPSIRSMLHLYGEVALERWDRAEAAKTERLTE